MQHTIMLVREISQASLEQREFIEQINEKIKMLLEVIDQHNQVAIEISNVAREVRCTG